MSYLGKVQNNKGKQYRLFTTAEEASNYVNSHDLKKYDYKPVTVYGVFLKKK